jgi:hypothetical protein
MNIGDVENYSTPVQIEMMRLSNLHDPVKLIKIKAAHKCPFAATYKPIVANL